MVPPSRSLQTPVAADLPVMKHLLFVLGALQLRPLGTAHSQPPEPEAGVPETTNPPTLASKLSDNCVTSPPGVIAVVA